MASPCSCIPDRRQVSSRANIRARGQKGPGASGATALHPPQALILLCCQDSALRGCLWHSSFTGSSLQPRICESCSAPGRSPCEAGGRILPWPQLAITISKPGRCLQERPWSFPNPSSSQRGAEPLLAKGPITLRCRAANKLSRGLQHSLLQLFPSLWARCMPQVSS